MNRVWAIRQKSTGYFIPLLKGASRQTGAEPTKDCVPRLFNKEQWAHYALNRWLEGIHHMESFPSSHESFYNDDCRIEVTPVEGRNKEDMEVVEFELVEVLK